MGYPQRRIHRRLCRSPEEKGLFLKIINLSDKTFWTLIHCNEHTHNEFMALNEIFLCHNKNKKFWIKLQTGGTHEVSSTQEKIRTYVSMNYIT